MMEASDGVERKPVIKQVLVDEAGKKEQVGWPISGESLGEDAGELGKVFAVPLGLGAVHGGRKHHAEARSSPAKDGKFGRERRHDVFD